MELWNGINDYHMRLSQKIYIKMYILLYNRHGVLIYDSIFFFFAKESSFIFFAVVSHYVFSENSVLFFCTLISLSFFHSSFMYSECQVSKPREEFFLWSQFHQHLTRGFFVQKFRAELFCTYILGLCIFGARILAQRARVKCWWNWRSEWCKNEEKKNFFRFFFLFFRSNFLHLHIRKC